MAIQKYERNITEGSQQRQRQRQWQGREAIYDACVWRNEYEKKKLMARLGFLLTQTGVERVHGVVSRGKKNRPIKKAF